MNTIASLYPLYNAWTYKKSADMCRGFYYYFLSTAYKAEILEMHENLRFEFSWILKTPR